MNISFQYLKSQQTVGELRKVVMEAHSPKVNNSISSTGDKRFVARTRSETLQASSNEGFTPLSTTEETSNSVSPSSEAPSERPLKPRTLNYSKLNKARTNLEVDKAFKDLGIEIL
jgi:hypothetical protein